VTEGEGTPSRRESLSLRRNPSLADVHEWIARDKAEREYLRKQQLKQARVDAARRANDEYKALAKRWAAPTAAVRKPKNPSKPENPTEARGWLSTVAEHVGETLKAYRAHKLPLPVEDHGVEAYAAARMQRDQWLSDVRRLWWFVSTVKAYLSEGNKKRLGRLLGLERGPGHSGGRRKPGESVELVRQISAQRGTKSEKRKTSRGRPERRTWEEIGRDHGMSAQAARKRVRRASLVRAEDDAKGFAEEFLARLKQRHEQKPRRAGKAKAATKPL
jgi:hypothetical protein